MPSDDSNAASGRALAPTSPILSRAELAQVGKTRERAIAALSDAFAHDALDVDELERRVTLAHTSESADTIASLLADLPAAETALAAASVHRAAPATEIAQQTIRAILGVDISMRLPGNGKWQPHRRQKRGARATNPALAAHGSEPAEHLPAVSGDPRDARERPRGDR